MRLGKFVWLICSVLCFVTFTNGQPMRSAYFLVLGCVLPPDVAKKLRRAYL